MVTKLIAAVRAYVDGRSAVSFKTMLAELEAAEKLPKPTLEQPAPKLPFEIGATYNIRLPELEGIVMVESYDADHDVVVYRWLGTGRVGRRSVDRFMDLLD